MNKIKIINLIGAGLWIAIPWCFFLGFGSDLLAIILIFALVAVIATDNRVARKPADVYSLTTLAGLGLGAAIVDPLNELGGFNHIANTLFNGPYVLPLVCTLACTRIYSLQNTKAAELSDA